MLSLRIFSIFLFALGAFLLYIAWQITTEYSYEPLGPRPFPLVSLFLWMLCCILLLFFAGKSQIHWGDLRLWKKFVILSLSLFAFAFLFEILGFVLSASLLVFVLSLLFGARMPQALIFALFCGWGFYYFFENLLQITLPLGLIFD
ncbi:tripartite tricarboxylate transporter TctB family protein [Campylobacter sp.]|uniref:tripartite tricarboxylate transporter TctB family protein n=1 Tax=Campylobacter sp. TaxID=205 RepID=UPI0026DB0670|nr:tripartite tricarboxylate transporter TctB family protein [Campylobacter sp.]MDO4673652.1 tripartite tricarboxylate transporter TctB family protein [Campylobacter sp.]